MEENIAYYDTYENNLQLELLKLCSSHKALKGTLLSSEDIDARWHDLAPHFMADAVKQVNSYPMATFAWASYVGMAVAQRWDQDWMRYCEEPYEALYGKEGFDDMDEKIVQEILGLELESPEAETIAETLRSAAQLCMTFIRREEVESQSKKAFYILARTLRVMFRIGAAMQLHRLGYKFEKMAVGEPYN